MEKNSLRIYGDSISNPRYGEGVEVDEIWPELLAEKLDKLYASKTYITNRSVNGITIYDALNIVRNLEYCFTGKSGIVIIHLGIVDCAPRPIPNKLKKIISKTPDFIKNRIIKFLHDNRKTLLKIKSYNVTPLKRFKKTYTKIVNGIDSQNLVLCLGIGPVSQEMQERSYGLKESLSKYNDCIKEIAEKYNAIYLDTDSFFRNIMHEQNLLESDVLLQDGHHYTKKGHVIASNILFNIIKEKTGINEK